MEKEPHRHGATISDDPLIGLIPLNMAREILIVLGGDNDRFL